MSRRPKDGAKTWSLNIRDVPVDLYWLFDRATNKARTEFGKWALTTLKKEARELLKENPKEKRAKS
jgi:hypothetical protein